VAPDAPPRVLLATFGSPGDLFPFLAIAEALAARGAEVTLASSAAYRDRVEARGIPFAHVRPDRPEQLQDPDLSERVGAGADPREVFIEMFLRDLRPSFDDALPLAESADVIVTHPLALGPALAAEVCGVPRIPVQLQPMGFFSAHEPPALGPPHLADALWKLPSPLAIGMRSAARRLTSAWATPWHHLRRDLGLPPDPYPLMAMPAQAPRTLALFSHLLSGSQPDWPESTVITGFPFLSPNKGLTTAPGVTPDVEAFVADGPPPIVFTLGTTAIMDPGAFFDVSAAAAVRTGRRAILVMGPLGPSHPELVDRGVLAMQWLDHGWAFPRASLVVHQGGIGTLAQAMRAGRPMIVMPYAHDQPDNARRMERLGIGRRIERSDYHTPAVAGLLTSLLGDTAVLRRARDVGDVVRMEDGASVAAREILAIAAR